MGLLDKLLSKEVKEKLGDLTKKINEAIDDIKENMDKKEEKAEEVVSSTENTVEEVAEEFPEPVYAQLKVKRKEVFAPFEAALGSDIEDHGSLAYFTDVIAKNLPDVTVSSIVPLETLGGEIPAKKADIDLLLSKDGKQALAILLVPKNKYRLTKYINTMNACEDAGVPAIRFMKEFSNEPAYMIGRIKALIG